jgi:hypothetical protein
VHRGEAAAQERQAGHHIIVLDHQAQGGDDKAMLTSSKQKLVLLMYLFYMFQNNNKLKVFYVLFCTVQVHRGEAAAEERQADHHIIVLDHQVQGGDGEAMLMLSRKKLVLCMYLLHMKRSSQNKIEFKAFQSVFLL